MAELQKNYQKAKAEAKNKALEYENQMLKELVKILVYQNTVKSDLNQQPKEEEVQINDKQDQYEVGNDGTQYVAPSEPIFFTRKDFEEADEYDGDDYDDYYYEEDENYEYYEEDEEQYEEEEEEDEMERDMLSKAFGPKLSDPKVFERCMREGLQSEAKVQSIETLDYDGMIKGMKELYGDGYQEILAMETQLQLKFNKFCDETQACLWPVLPINMKFEN